MNVRRNSFVPLALVALALSSRPTPAPGCSFSEPTLFVTPYAPDTPPARYVAGELRYPKSPWATGTKYWFEGRGWYPPTEPRKSPQS